MFPALDISSPSTVRSGSGANSAYAIDGILGDSYFFSDKDKRKWIEITLSEPILIPQVKIFTLSVSINHHLKT